MVLDRTRNMLPSILSRSSSKQDKAAHHVPSISGITYKNPWPSAEKPTWTELLGVSNPFSWYSNHQLHANARARDIEVVRPDWGAGSLAEKGLGDRKGDCVIGTWLGHAGVMIQMPIVGAGGGKGSWTTTTTTTDGIPQDSSPAGGGEVVTSTLSGESLWVLVDPIFSERAGPTQYTGPSRIKNSPCSVSDLPACDVVLISHNHYDHLDLATIKSISKRFPKCKFFVPLGNKAWLASVVRGEQVIELDWWQHREMSAVDREVGKSNHEREESTFRFTCVPAQHNSGRGAIDQGNTLWCGWVIEQLTNPRPNDSTTPPRKRRRNGAVYHAGDTGYRRTSNSTDTCPAFAEIGEKLGPFDLSFLPIWRGGSLGFVSYVGLRLSHHEIPSTFHASPRDAICIHKDVKSRNSVGVHFGTFIGSENESYEAVIEFDEAGENANVGRLDDSEVGRFGRAGVLDIGGSLAVVVGEDGGSKGSVGFRA